jgi:hypothetical protein
MPMSQPGRSCELSAFEILVDVKEKWADRQFALISLLHVWSIEEVVSLLETSKMQDARLNHWIPMSNTM